MRWVRAVNTARGTLLGARIGVADRWWLRLRGLQVRTTLPSGEGLLLRPCRAIHMIGMRFAIDVAFLDRRGVVVAQYRNLPPGGRTRWHRAAHDALELPAGTLAVSGTVEGDTVVCTEEGV